VAKLVTAKEIVSRRLWEAVEKIFEAIDTVRSEIPQREFIANIEGQATDLLASIIIASSSRADSITEIIVDLENKKIIAKLEEGE